MLRGKVALVTGSAQRIGFGIAEILARNGAHVVLNDIEGERLTSAVETMKSRGYAVSTALGDVSQTSSVRETVDIARSVTGKIDILVNNAGIVVFIE